MNVFPLPSLCMQTSSFYIKKINLQDTENNVQYNKITENINVKNFNKECVRNIL